MIPIIILSSIGLLISLYFTLVYRGVLRSDSTMIPQFCRMDNESCLSIIKTREARIIGIPNFYLGILFYLAILAVALFPALTPYVLDSLKIASGFTVIVGIVLSYTLLFVMKKNCVLCFTAHVVNLILFVLLLLS